MSKTNSMVSIRALFGGTFDPPHYGHLLPLQEIADICQFTKIDLLPANIPALKSKISNSKHRIAMTRLLCDCDSRFTLNLIEHEKEETSYTINTLISLQQRYSKQKLIFIIGLDSLNTLNKWHQWEQLFDYCHLVVMTRPKCSEPKANQDINTPSGKVVIPEAKLAPKLYDFYTEDEKLEKLLEPSVDKQTRETLLSKLGKTKNDQQSINYSQFMDIIATSASGKLWFVENKTVPVSSTFVRKQISLGKNIDKWVPQTIVQYISEHNLYR